MATLEARVAAALQIVLEAGSVDGAHHKQWVLDQVVRQLTGCPEVEGTAVDCNGQTYTYTNLGTSEAYEAWVRRHNDPVDGVDQYEWDVGIPP